MSRSSQRFAYADPPYLGQCKRYGHPHIAPYGCWDEIDTHASLLQTLAAEFDAWAVSGSAPSMRTLWPLTPPKTRLGVWVKSYSNFSAVSPHYTWEGLLFVSAGADKGVWDWHKGPASLGGRDFLGAKPEHFSMWMFRLLGAVPGDEFTDLFPGSGAVSQAWWKFCGQLEMKYA